jgi:urease accessory protein
VNAPAHDEELQRASGVAQIVVGACEGATRLIDVIQKHPFRVMFPKVVGQTVSEAVLVNASGGIAGGDHLELSLTAEPHASMTVTSQAAEKIYRALSKPAQINTRLTLAEGARIAWLPQETIVFNQGRFVRDTQIHLDPKAELLALEWLVLGRAGFGEELLGGHIHERWRVRIDGRLAWADSFRVTESMFALLGSKALLGGCKALGTLVCFSAHPRSRLEFFRDSAASLPCECSATYVGGVVVIRLASQLSSGLRLALRSLIEVPKMWSC